MPTATMEATLPYKSVVLFIACGAMVFLIVFVFVKRQITRFALKSNRVPHAAIGASAPKSVRRQIECRLRRVEDIKYEPQLLVGSLSSAHQDGCPYYFRMKAVDGLKLLDSELQSLFPSTKRCHGSSLRAFLLDQQLHTSGCLYGIRLEIIDKFASMYEHACHDPAPFHQDEYQEYMDLMSHMVDHAKKKLGQECVDGMAVNSRHSADTDRLSSTEQHDMLLVSRDKQDKKAKSSVSTTVAGLPVETEASEVLHEFHGGEVGEDMECPRAVTESDSGMFLLATRYSGSSQGSTVELETRFRPSGGKTGEESYV